MKGEQHGPTRLYDEGRLRTLMHFEKGKQNGPFLSFDEQGSEVCALVLQERQARRGSLFFDAKGNTLRKANYKADKLHGEVIEYFPNGEVRERVTYENGKKQGDGFSYDVQGKLKAKATYKDGEKRGEVEYDDKGIPKAKSEEKETSFFDKIVNKLAGG